MAPVYTVNGVYSTIFYFFLVWVSLDPRLDTPWGTPLDNSDGRWVDNADKASEARQRAWRASNAREVERHSASRGGSR